ncbi:hypothetical protein KRP22_011270 [Phytophthora ramorum]|uniref:uncharacterized protein n=1 Tax=Phytophthora ramorum TaxID=164328 RepID=UPI00309EB7FB|nr:hypothetical protein KRP23_5177 [Phytophthora ramorum]KAH7494946.1 hypothetical protein KRP22_15266 [Phytophthora ramorum]
MRLSVFLFAAAATLLANPITVEASVATPDTLNSNDFAQNDMDDRSLRIREAVDADLEDNSDDEERAGITEVAAKLTKSSSLKSLLDEVETLKTQAYQLMDSNKELFKQISKMIDNPYQLREKLGISEKLKTMSAAQLDKDMNYHLWMEYSKWWKGTYGKDLGF